MVVSGTLGRGNGAGYPRQQSKKAGGVLGDCVSCLCYSIYFSHLYKTQNKAIEANSQSLWLLSLGGRQCRRGTQGRHEGPVRSSSRGWLARKLGGKQAVERRDR